MDRKKRIKRDTTETKIDILFNLDGTGKYTIDTKIGFFNHMLELFAKHGKFDLDVKMEGDIHIDFHHSVEDVGIVLGQAIKEALGEKKGIKRYGTFYVPMMEALSRATLDISNRGYLVFKADLNGEKVGEFDTELVEEFLFSVCNNAGINLHIDLIRGKNTHHIIESIFKSFARALYEATRIVGEDIPSTKGII